MSVVPDLIKLSQVPVNFASKIETDLLEPVVQQDGSATGDGFCRFDLQRKGFLHSQSKLFISLRPAAGATANYLPPNIGIGSVIKRATLKVGNQVLNEISDWSSLHVIKSAEIDNENNVERELYTTGRYLNHKWLYRGTASTATTFPTAERYGLDIGREYGDRQTSLQRDLKMIPFANYDGDTPTECPTYQVDLSDLFPFLKTHSLPLYMIQDQLSIELTWAPKTDKRLCRRPLVGATEVSIELTDLKFCADYIFYTDSDMMTRYQEANPVIEFAFPDYRLSKNSLTQAQLRDGVVRNLGMANRQVSRVLTLVSDDATATDSILGPYHGRYPSRASATQKAGPVVVNYRYNDRFEFPTSKRNPAEHFTHFTQSESIPFVSREEYSREQRGLTDYYTFEGHDQASAAGLPGQFFMLGTRLTNGRVGQRGIELHLQMGDAANPMAVPVDGVYTARSFCEYMRLARLESGMFSVFNA